MQVSISQAVIALIAVFYCWNYECSAHVARPLQFLQRYYLKILSTAVKDSMKEYGMLLHLNWSTRIQQKHCLVQLSTTLRSTSRWIHCFFITITIGCSAFTFFLEYLIVCMICRVEISSKTPSKTIFKNIDVLILRVKALPSAHPANLQRRLISTVWNIKWVEISEMSAMPSCPVLVVRVEMAITITLVLQCFDEELAMVMLCSCKFLMFFTVKSNLLNITNDVCCM